mmetsp:Transcript_76938/g.222432  ORF Transcript_76938/g.222432 Transcript_76938/m.222432 type:complete len:180 (+) Transcript_76938:109-648(+)
MRQSDNNCFAASLTIFAVNVVLLCMLWEGRLPAFIRYTWVVMLAPASLILACFDIWRNIPAESQTSHQCVNGLSSYQRSLYEAERPASPFRAKDVGANIVPDLCCVCLEAHSDGELVRRLPCGHEFHVKCIDAWLLRGHGMSSSCPTCRCRVHVHFSGRRQRHRRQPFEREVDVSIFAV